MTDAALVNPGGALPALRPVTTSDLKAVLAAGWTDFKAAPVYGLVFGAFYAAGGLIVLLLATRLDLPFLIFPAIAGFALIGPFAAVGLYEVSRRRERGEPLTWPAVLGAIKAKGGKEIAILGVILFFLLAVWLKAAAVIYALFFGLKVIALDELVASAFSSFYGLSFFLVGNAIGAAFALAAFAISVLSFPLLVDRDLDFVSAIITSIRAVAADPRVLITWGVIVAALLALACLPFFLGLIVVLPVLGHSSWHLYRRIVAA